MPAFIHLIRIDWHVDSASDAVRAALAQGDPADGSDHTLDTLQEELETFAAAHPDAVGDALADTGYNSFALLRVRGGNVEQIEVEERPADRQPAPASLPYDNALAVGPREVPLEYADEAALRAFIDGLAGAGAGSFVATVNDGTRYLVELAPKRTAVRRLEVVTEPALVARLLRGDYKRVPAATRSREPSTKYEQALYWPEAMLAFVQREAMRTDRSLSYVVQFAFKHARATIAAGNRESLESARTAAGLVGGDKQKQTLYFPGAMLDELIEESTRLDSSVSFVAQTAVALARAAIAELPPSGGEPVIEALPTVDALADED